MALEQLGTPESPTFGLDTFGDRGTDAHGRRVSHADAIRQVVEEAVLADQLGSTSSASGSTTARTSRSPHPTSCSRRSHGRTGRIRLGTSVTVLSSDDLFAKLLREEPVTWEGTIRPRLTGERAYPPTESGRLPVWVGVGGTPESVVRAAKYAMPLVLP